MKTITLAAAFLATTALPGAAQAQSVAALVGDDSLAFVDVGAKKVTKTMKLSDATGKLVGIDVRPADGILYGVTADGAIWTIDTGSGKATQKSKLSMKLPEASAITVDFNPVADRLRVIGADGTNLRINVDDGTVTKDGDLKFADTNMHKGERPKVVAGAYSNSFKGAKETALYDIDATTGGLLKQAPPNDGVLNAIGKLGVKAESYAFDIAADGSGGNEGWLMAGGTLYWVDVASGKATEHGKIAGIAGTVRDIAVLPKM